MSDVQESLKRRSFSDLLYQEVISKGLCTLCGACAGICPNGSILINGVIPELGGECDGCGSCYDACPGKEIHLDVLDQKVFGRARRENEKRIGIHAACYAANAKESSVRNNATSGGVLTSLLLYAFDKGLIVTER